MKKGSLHTLNATIHTRPNTHLLDYFELHCKATSFGLGKPKLAPAAKNNHVATWLNKHL